MNRLEPVPREPVPVLLMARELGHGGSERQLAEMAKALDRNRFAPHAGCFVEGTRAEELRAAGVPIVVLPVVSFRSAGAVACARQLGRYIREHRILVVHSYDWPLNCFAAPVARFYRVPVVLTSQRSHRELRTRWVRRMLRITDRIADGIVVNSEAIRKELLEDEGVQPGKIRLCYNGIDLNRFRAGPRVRPAELSDASIVIGVVAVLRPEKGLSTLVEAFAQIAPSNPGARLLITGSGPMGQALVELAGKLGVGEQCMFQPSTAEVTPWLHAIDIFVQPSLSEAFSNSIMEAMACGCCVVASRAGGNPEQVIEGETGLLFESANATDLAERLSTVIADAGLRRQLAENGTRRVGEKFSMAASAQCMGEIYDDLLDINLGQSADLRAR
jgi:glycosyltransferase involved in cell wall biosynthesis